MRLLNACAWLALGIGLAIGVGWAALHLWIVPRITDFRPALEQLASQAVGLRVQIGRLQAQGTGWVPSFELGDIALTDAQGQAVLQLPRVVVAISLRSVLQLNLEQLVLDRPDVDVHQSANGQWRVAGLPIHSVGTGHSAVADWLLSQREVVVRSGRVRWHTELARPAADPPSSRSAVLQDMDIVLRNRLHRHEWRIDVTPPPDWGERFVVMGQFTRPLLSTHPGHFSDWSGQVFAHFPHIDVARLQTQVPDALDLQSGQGRLRLWADVERGQWLAGTLDLDLHGVRWQLHNGALPLALREISGRMTVRHGPHQWSLHAQELNFLSEEGLRWPGGQLALDYSEAHDGSPAQGQLQGERLELQALREVALRLSLPPAWQTLLEKHRMAGQVKSMSVQWTGDATELKALQGQLDVDALHVQNTVAGEYGIDGARLHARFGLQEGQLQLQMPQGGWLDWPGILEENRITLQQLQADLRWTLVDAQLKTLQWKARVANEDLAGQSQGSWKAEAAKPLGSVDLQGRFERVNAARLHRYLPLALSAEVRHYVRDSVRKGQIRNLQMRVRGALDQLPASTPGDWRFAGQLQDVEMAYLPASLLPSGSPPWPALQGLQGELVFEGKAMHLQASNARLGSGEARQTLQVSRLRADIADLGHEPLLQVQGELKGSAGVALHQLQTSPLDALLSGALSQASATGSLQGRLALDIPLLRTQDTRVRGNLVFNGNDLQIHPRAPLLGRVQGAIEYTEKGFSLQGVQARLLGGNSRFEGGLRSAAPAGEAALLIRAQGQITAEGLRAARSLQPLDALARQAKGQASYTASLGWRDTVPELTLQSSLEGLELSLPAPLTKRASQSLPLLVTSRAQGPGGQRDLLQIDIGEAASALYVRDLSGASARVLRGNLAVGTRTGGVRSLPEQGVSAVVRLDELPLDAWDAALQGSATLANSDDDSWRSYLPNRLGLQAGTISMQGRTLHEVVAGITRDGTRWRANVDARELSGHAQYQQPDGAQAGRLYARLSRLNLPPSAVSEVESMLETPPRSMPALDIQIDDLELRGKHLGRVDIQAVNTESSSAPREWQLQKFNLSVPEATLQASGRWMAAAEGRPRRTVMDFRLDVQDAGALLSRLGTPGALRAGAGHLDGQIGWNGSPLALHYPSLQGQFQIRMSRGQFLKADPGVAKLLGVLSLQGLPRRLLLDFRDVFYEGFSFDSVQGDVQIASGIASTNNLQIEGINAIVKMAGSADIARETQQLKVLILPQLNAGGASVVAGLAINPVVGLTSFLAQWLLSQPLSRATIQEFSIDGSWSEPHVSRVELPAGANGSP